MLDRVHRLLAALDHPERRLPPVIHVAGTNGKGSTLAMIRAGLEGAGGTCHVYTSPHLARFHERIRVAGDLIAEDALIRLLEECEAANGPDPITYFEITTCAALLAFARAPADWTLLEVGLGGRLDATNVVDAPALTVITPVSMDHEAYLGDTLGAIAGEKAGILKRGAPCIVGRQEDVALEVIEARAARLGAPLHVHGQHWHVAEERGRLVFQDEDGLMDLPLPRLIGRHQVENAGTAIAALRVLGRARGAEAAMTRAEWPARLQRLRRRPARGRRRRGRALARRRPQPRRGRGAGRGADPPAAAPAPPRLRDARDQGRHRLHAPARAARRPPPRRLDPRRARHAARRRHRRRRRPRRARGARAALGRPCRRRHRGRGAGRAHPDLRLALPRGPRPARERLRRGAPRPPAPIPIKTDPDRRPALRGSVPAGAAALRDAPVDRVLPDRSNRALARRHPAPDTVAMIRAALLAAVLAAPAQAATHGFCWTGAEGYRIEGTIAYPDGATGVLTEDDLTAFEIAGFRDDAYLGRWSLADRTPDASVTIRFDADALAFPMGGRRADGTYQAWNANGFADDCGDPGFGFNGGDRAQDVCVDGTFIDESGIDPDTPLAIAPDAANPCGPMLMSALRPR